MCIASFLDLFLLLFDSFSLCEFAGRFCCRHRRFFFVAFNACCYGCLCALISGIQNFAHKIQPYEYSLYKHGSVCALSLA